MKEVPLQEWARRLLEDQIDRLGELRNANPRDAGFKLWRQTTLTVIQRVWPGNLQKSERFRRIPFSTPSSKASRAQMREYHERGCGEAISHLRGLLMEIDSGGLDPSQSPVLPRFSSSEFGMEPGMDLPATPPPSRFTSPASEKSLEDLKAAESTPPAIHESAASNPPPQPPVRATTDRPAKPAPQVSSPASRGGRPPRRGEKRALKDMLGFSDGSASAERATSSSPAMPAERVESFSPPRPAPSFGSPVHEPPAPAPPAAVRSKEEREVVTEGSREAPEAMASNVEDDFLDCDGEAAVTAVIESEDDDAAAKFLKSSPVLSAKARPPSAERRTRTVPQMETAIASALMAVAGEVAALGVPEGQRAAMRAALMSLARQFDDRSATWASLRQVVSLVLDHPVLARRTIPLLVPFLDLE